MRSFEPLALTTLWRNVVGEDPEQDEMRPREGIRRQFGNLDETFGLELQVQALRMDWYMGARLQEDRPPAADFGPVDAALAKFSDLFRPWFPKFAQRFHRIAVGSVLLLPVSDRLAGYTRISRISAVTWF